MPLWRRTTDTSSQASQTRVTIITSKAASRFGDTVIFLFVPDEEDEGAHKSCSLFHHTGFILQGHPMRHGSKTQAEPGDLWQGWL